MRYSGLVAADLHLYGPKPTKRRDWRSADVLLGDIFDAEYVIKSERELLVRDIIAAKKLFGERYTSGNHEKVLPIGEVYVTNGIVFTHGDNEANPTKWLAYRKDTKGAGFFKRQVLSKAIRFGELAFDRPLKADFLDRAVSLALKHFCNTYVCGHFHVDEKLVMQHKGIQIIVLPRGFTKLEIE